MLINACREHPYLPVSLPRRDFMEKALARWEALGLPALDLKTPWHGYPLSAWTPENAEEAELAVTGRYFETGAKLAKRRAPTDYDLVTKSCQIVLISPMHESTLPHQGWIILRQAQDEET